MSAMCETKTFEEHLHYLRQIVGLKLWFVGNWLKNHPHEDFTLVLRWRVDIFRKTVFWQGTGFPTQADFEAPAWLALERQAQAIYTATRRDPDPSGFERPAFDLLWEAVEANAFRDYQASLADKGFQCDSLGYSPPAPEQPSLVHFHVTNALQPRSFLNDREYLTRCFSCLMDQAEAEYGADSLGTGSWLNSYPRWLELFPQEYMDHMGPEEQDVGCGLGHWGQFITARGTFNQKHADILRRTGRLPYHRRYAWCSFNALREHLATPSSPSA